MKSNYTKREVIENLLEENYQLEKENKELKSTKQNLINDVRKYSCQALDLERKNKQQKEIIDDYREQNFELREDLGTYKNKYNKLFDENKLLIKRLYNLETMFDEVYDNELETRDKKNEILKWAYTLEKENKKLKNELFNIYLNK